MTREIQRLINDHDNTYAQTMTSLEKRLDAKADRMKRKVDEILLGSYRESRSGPMENTRQATDGSGTHRFAEAPPRSTTSFEPKHRKRPSAATSIACWTTLITPNADATSGARLPTGPDVR